MFPAEPGSDLEAPVWQTKNLDLMYFSSVVQQDPRDLISTFAKLLMISCGSKDVLFSSMRIPPCTLVTVMGFPCVMHKLAPFEWMVYKYMEVISIQRLIFFSFLVKLLATLSCAAHYLFQEDKL